MVPAKKRAPPGRTCTACRKKSSIYAFLSPFLYNDEVIRGLVSSLKYQRVKSLGPTLGDMLTEYQQKFDVSLPRGALFIPIPLHTGRQRIRGFNQAELIAKRLGERLGLAMETGALLKVKKTTPQVELSAEERRKNVIDTFAVSKAMAVKGRTVLLLDDVKTTGATLEEAARVLKEAGAKKIWAITVAH
ncbi:MAG: ComF family protein [Candidatus Sungbacteria bacterium]|nr:ComF family protein [Candidatus Sungbacteria bacterium]